MSSDFGATKIKSALHTYVGFKFANLILGIAFQIVVVKTLPPIQYATFALFLAVLTAGEQFLSFGLDRTTMRFVPALTRRKDNDRLRALVARILAIRVIALFLFAAVCIVGVSHLEGLIPTKPDTKTFVAFVIWFLSITLMGDADAFAQSWLAHLDLAVASFMEVSARTLATIAVALLTPPGATATTIVTICAATSSVALFYLLGRLARFTPVLARSKSAIQLNVPDATFDPRRALGFAMANYASTIVYLVSSPAVIRVVASAGLNVVALAAFSFIQALAVSVQRVLPGLLVLPTLEPIIMSRILGENNSKGTLSGLSLVFKLEISFILCGIIITVVAGEELITLLSRAEYGPYANILVVFLIYVAFATSYRLLEMVVNTNFQQRVFFFVWPVSVVSLVATYLTVGKLGLVAVLLFPTLEIALRVSLLAVLFRRYGTFRLFDPVRTLPLIASAITIAAMGKGAVWLSGASRSMSSDLGIATIAAILFLGSIATLKVLRMPEYEVMAMSFPDRWRSALAVIRRGVRT